jgi:hypothetical protein
MIVIGCNLILHSEKYYNKNSPVITYKQNVFLSQELIVLTPKLQLSGASTVSVTPLLLF